jgi:hypothetical protein
VRLYEVAREIAERVDAMWFSIFFKNAPGDPGEASVRHAGAALTQADFLLPR